MADTQVILADLDEIVFETRNRDYGAYDLRKNYNKSLMRAALIALLLFVFGMTSPKIYKMLFVGSKIKPKVEFASELELIDFDEPPELEDQPEPPPPIELPKPEIKTIEFKVPEPIPDDEILEEETLHDIEELEEVENIGLEDVEGDTSGYDFSDIDEGDGDGVAVVEEPADPDPNAFIMVEKEPAPVNMNDIKGLIGYPPTAKEAEIEGKVIVRILVGKNGRYSKHIVVKNPHPILTKAVEAQLRNIQFTPGIQAGKPIKVWVTIPFDFKLMR